MRYRIYLDGYVLRWFKNNIPHRLYGHARECSNGNKEWYQNGKLHREDGPAIEYSSGGKEWCLYHIQYSEEKFNKVIKVIKGGKK